MQTIISSKGSYSLVNPVPAGFVCWEPAGWLPAAGVSTEALPARWEKLSQYGRWVTTRPSADSGLQRRMLIYNSVIRHTVSTPGVPRQLAPPAWRHDALSTLELHQSPAAHQVMASFPARRWNQLHTSHCVVLDSGPTTGRSILRTWFPGQWSNFRCEKRCHTWHCNCVGQATNFLARRSCSTSTVFSLGRGFRYTLKHIGSS